MYEIELKAHVTDRQNTIELINSFATFLGTTIKDDVYFHFTKTNLQEHITCRIRHEEYTFADGTSKSQDLLTYKSKERRLDQNGATFEVNEENETVLSDSSAIIKLLTDTGYQQAYTKHKDVMQWTTTTKYGDAHLELCNVPPLGDFLEIEILTESNSNSSEINEELQKLIQKAGIPLSNIEKRYYSELLKLAKGE